MSIWRNSVGLPTTKGLVEKYHDYNQYDETVVKFGVPEKDGCRNNEDSNEPAAIDIIENRAIRHSQKAILWENFLPLRSLKVLVVENDDSTRYTVSALLRNCSYEVIAVSNGLEAWETLEDVTNRVDLVLTEVAMPCLSGIDLLSKIMSDKTCKDIPVIMMSSNDSVNIVFKCLSNGAVDFLLKPIRKNELKNIWQHVWRKCRHGLGGGSGSESGVQTENSTKSKSVDGSNLDTDLNYEEGNGSTGLTFRNGSDNDSGNQSACSKRALEVHSSEPIAQLDDVANLPDSTSEIQVSANTTRIIQDEGDEHDDVTMGKDLTLAEPITPELHFRNPSNEVLAGKSNTGMSKFLDLDMNKDPRKQGKEVVEDNTVTTNSDINLKDNDAIVSIMNVTVLSCGEIVRNEFVSDSSRVIDVDSYDGKEPSLELGLQRPNVLGHSDHSAFSRYNNTTSTNKQALTRNVGSCSSINNSLESGKIESIPHLQQHDIISGTQNQGSNGSSSNNFDMGSTSNCVPDKVESLNGKSLPRSTISVDNRHAFKPVQHGHCPSVQTGISDTAKTVATQGMAMHHVQRRPLDGDDASSGNIIDATVPHCGTSNKLGIKGIEGNAANNYESASGSNGPNGGSNGRNSIIDNNTSGGSGSRSGTEQDRLALREAALFKFRQKRKDRCFEKKVRYQKRKKLAEQRPRVRGQFVKQKLDENKSNEYDV